MPRAQQVLNNIRVNNRAHRNYTPAQVDDLLDIVASKLPCGGDEWDEVGRIYNMRHNDGRTGEDLKNKFKKLKNSKKPTGDPNFPPEVRKAKHIQREIEDRMSVLELNDDDDEDLEAGHAFENVLNFHIENDVAHDEDEPPHFRGVNPQQPQPVVQPQVPPRQPPRIPPRNSANSLAGTQRTGYSVDELRQLQSSMRSESPIPTTGTSSSSSSSRKRSIDNLLDDFRGDNISTSSFMLMNSEQERAREERDALQQEQRHREMWEREDRERAREDRYEHQKETERVERENREREREERREREREDRENRREEANRQFMLLFLQALGKKE